MIKGTPAQALGDPAATYAAVVNNHHLDVQVYVPGLGLVTEVIVFTAVPNSQALFIAAINAQAKHFTAKASGTSLLLSTNLKGSLAAATVLASTSADVKASLGFPIAQAFDPSFGVRMLGTPHSGKSSVLFFGGRKPVIGGVPQSALQHAIVLRGGRVGLVLVVDRQTVAAVSQDSVRFRPEHDPGAG